MAECQELVRRAHEELGGLDVIVGNAVCQHSYLDAYEYIQSDNERATKCWGYAFFPLFKTNTAE